MKNKFNHFQARAYFLLRRKRVKEREQDKVK